MIRGIIARMRKIVIKTKKMKRPKGKNRIISALFVFAILIPVVASAEFPSNQQPYPPDLYSQCFDGIDNDGDGKIDLKDSDCPKCFDGIDNDGDKDIDLADSDCPKAKKGGVGAVAAALFGLGNQASGESNIATGKPTEGGAIASGGVVAVAETSCSGRISVFPRRVRTESGFFYVSQHTACINLTAIGNDISDSRIFTRRNATPRGNPTGSRIIAVSENIPVVGSTATGNPISTGGTIAIGNPALGGFVPIGGNIPIGGTIPIGNPLPIGGDVSSGSIPVGGTIPGGGII